MGAYGVHRARLFGTFAEKTGIVPFMDLVEQVMTTEPYASARRVVCVVDKGQRSIDRMTEAWPTARLVHLPIPRVVAQPDRDRVLHHPTQSHQARRLR